MSNSAYGTSLLSVPVFDEVMVTDEVKKDGSLAAADLYIEHHMSPDGKWHDRDRTYDADALATESLARYRGRKYNAGSLLYRMFTPVLDEFGELIGHPNLFTANVFRLENFCVALVESDAVLVTENGPYEYVWLTQIGVDLMEGVDDAAKMLADLNIR